VTTDITAALTSYLSSNLGPDPSRPGRRGPPDYGVTGSLDGERLAVTLTFRAGACYCCMEWGCHLPLHDGKPWVRFRAALTANGIAAPACLVLALTVVVEAGARFFNPFRPDRAHPGEYELEPATAQRFAASAAEAPSTATATS
jgi:hypothetical protein